MKVIFDHSQARHVRETYDKKEKETKSAEMHRNYGRVPNYLNKFNREREEDAIRKMVEEERSRMPPGTRLMPEEERLETLKDLQDSYKEVNNTLEKLPVISKTLAMEKHKKELEDKMVRINRAIETFSKKQVYVAY